MPGSTRTQLVAIGVSPVDDHPGTIVLPAQIDGDGTEQLIDVLTSAAGETPVVIVCPSWVDDATRRNLQVARAAAEHGRVGIVTTALPPLAARLLVSQARELLDDDEAGWSVAALGHLERSYTAFALLRSLTGLRHPTPRFVQHVTSMLPGTTFLAATHPSPQVVRVRRGEAPSLSAPPAPVRAVVAAPDAGVDRLLAAVDAMLDVDALRVTPQASDTAAWGSDRVVQVVLAPQLSAARRQVLRDTIRVRACAWCGGRVTGDGPCVFCADAGDRRDAA